MELDMFQPRTMLEAVMQMKPPQRWLLDNFFSNVRTFDTETVDMDIYKDKRRMAPMGHPLEEGKVVNSLGYKTRNVKPGYTKPKMRTTAQDLMKRQPGSNLYTPVDPGSRAQAKLGEDLATLDDMITRRVEWMAWKAVQDGEITIDGDGDSRTIGFDFDPDHIEVLTGTDAWDDAAADPMNDLLTWRRLVLRNCGMAPTDCVLGNDASLAFLNHAKVKDWFNRWNFIPGQIRVQAAGNVIEYGFIPALGMSLYTVNEFFIDPDDEVEKEMLEAKNVVLLTRGARASQYYGAIQVIDDESGILVGGVSRFPWTWVTKDPSARWVQLHSAPLVVPEQPDAFFTAQVLE